MEDRKSALDIATQYEPDNGNLVGVNDFSTGHEAGQMFAAERIAWMIEREEAGSKAHHLLSSLVSALGDDFPAGSYGVSELLSEIDGYLSIDQREAE